MKTLAISDLDKINALTNIIRQHLDIKTHLLKESKVKNIKIEVGGHLIFTNTLSDFDKEKSKSYRGAYHEITRDYLSLLATHANTMILRKQDELLKIVKPEVGLAVISLYKVLLKEVNANKINVIKIIQENTELTLHDAQDLANITPCIIKQDLKESEAVNLARILTDTGALAVKIPNEFKPHLA